MALGAVAIFLIVALILFKPSKVNVSQQFPNTGIKPPQEFSNILTTQNPTASLAAISANHLSASNTFNITYNGYLYIQPSGWLSGIVNINAPLRIQEQIMGNSRKLFVNVSGLPGVGSALINYLESANGTFICTNFNATALKKSDIAKLSAQQMTCMKNNTLMGMNFSRLARFNFTQLQNSANFNYTTLYQSTYNSAPCTYIAGTLQQQHNNGKGSFYMCMSDIWGVPLTAGANLTNNQGSFGIILKS